MTGRANPLDPTVPARIRQALQPDWVHSVRIRRIAAGALVLLAAVAAVRSEPGGAHDTAVVATRDLDPGVTLTAEDVHTESRLTDSLPDGVRTDVGAVVGATPAGPVRRGEVLTDVRLFGSELAKAAAGADARVVPLHLAQSAVLDVIREGDVVDIVAASPSDPGVDPAPRVVATNAVVVLVSAESGGVGTERVVLVALPAAAATAVAAATLGNTVTLTLH